LRTRVIEDRFFEELGVTLVEYICYRNSASSMNELKTFLGDEKFLQLLNLFAGAYIVIPPAKKLFGDMYDYMAALSVLRIKKCKKTRDLKGWTLAEASLHQIARRTKRDYRYIQTRGNRTLAKIEKVKEWSKKMKIWEEKHLGEKA
jgi:hypothetical protein